MKMNKKFDHLAMWTFPDAVRKEDPKRMIERLKAAHVDMIVMFSDGYIYNSNTIYDPANQAGVDYRVIPVCYCAYCRKHAPIEKPEWGRWKQEQLTDLVAEQAKLIRKLKPGAPFSVAARMPYARASYAEWKNEIPYYDGWEYCQSRDAFGADWAEWMRRGHIDFACPMSYFNSPRLVELQTLECKSLFPQAATNIWMGLVLSRSVEFCQTLQACQTMGQFPDGPEKGDPALYNYAEDMEVLLNAQVEMGQRNCILVTYEQMLDEHIPVLAQFRNA